MPDKSDTTPNIPAIMAEIRARITADIARNKDARPALQQRPADINAGNVRKAGELLHSETLRNLNREHSYALNINPASITSHRGGFFGKVVVKLKQKVLLTLRDSLLKDYFHAEHAFQADLIRYLNDLTRYIDSRDAGNFWELVRKVDVDVTRAMERIERIADEATASRHVSERRMHDALNGEVLRLQHLITGLQGAMAQTAHTLTTVDGAVKGLESRIVQSPPALQRADEASMPQASGETNLSYLLFENRFRGSEAEISSRLTPYAQIFAGAELPVLELGPGRGELQEIFRDNKIPSYGVDMDRAMVDASAARGFDVRLGDGIAHLRSLSDRSLDGVIAVQVIEHISNELLQNLLENARRTLRPGGKIILETINPQSVLALSSNYYRDPTHVAPIHPDTLKYRMELLGFTDCAIHYQSPVPPEAKLKELSSETFMTPRWELTVERINQNIRQLNGLLYGPQDFFVIGVAR